MTDPIAFYLIAHHEFFETLDQYSPGREFISLVAKMCVPPWKITTGGFWSHCSPVGYAHQDHGWKIHVAGDETTAEELLTCLVPIFVKHTLPFKFCSDLNILRISTSKNAHRTAAGKFITAYPPDLQHFKSAIDECARATQHITGPYLLTDRPYKTSKAIFYRYGSHRGTYVLDPQGLRLPVMKSPQGQLVSDERVPYFQLPSWVSDPFPPLPTEGESDVGHGIGLKEGRYHVTAAIRYSSYGGIYFAKDITTGKDVVIREARPGLGQSTKLLLKEARILQTLAPTDLVPQFVDLFEECEHHYLVQERLDAQLLWHYSMTFLLGRTTSPRPDELFHDIREALRKIIHGLEAIHSHGIVVRDFAKTNVLFTNSIEPQVKFIDFELAYELDGREPPVPGGTWGYASHEQMRNDIPSKEDDYFALGGIILDAIAFSASELSLNREGALRSFKQILEDLGLPSALWKTATGLTAPCRTQRWNATRALETLVTATSPSLVECKLDPIMRRSSPDLSILPRLGSRSSTEAELRRTLKEILRYISNVEDLTRSDRLYPASAEVFFTNPVCIRFGAAGVAHFVSEISGEAPLRAVEWIVHRSHRHLCPAGLMSGLSGVAVVILKMGLVDQAEAILKSVNDLDDIFLSPGLFEGAAGWGLANLHFWSATKSHEYLANAVHVADRLLDAAQYDPNGAFWPSEGRVALGLGAGSSGIGLFFLYLYAVCRRAEFLAAAEAAINHDIENASWTGDRVDLHEFKGAPSNATKSPHTRQGSAGVATAAIRLHSLTHQERHLTFVKACIRTVCSRFTNKLWQDWGLAGFGELLVDAYQFLDDQRFLDAAYYLAGGILTHGVVKPEGTIFPGYELLRLSCDWGLGSAGIGLFFHRLINPNVRRFPFVDEVLNVRAAEALAPSLVRDSGCVDAKIEFRN